MNIEIEFNYQGQITNIQCNTQDNVNNIFQKLINKLNIDINLIYFLYSGNIIEGNIIIEKIINNADKERKKMNILVNNKEDQEGENKEGNEEEEKKEEQPEEEKEICK